MSVSLGVEYKQFHLYRKGRFVLRVENRGWATPWDEELRVSLWGDLWKDSPILSSKLGILWVVAHIDTATAEIKCAINDHQEFATPEIEKEREERGNPSIYHYNPSDSFYECKQLLIDNAQELFGYGWKVKDRSEYEESKTDQIPRYAETNL